MYISSETVQPSVWRPSTHPHAHLVEGIEPLAKNMAPLAEKRFVEGKFEDVAYFVPFYLKDFVAKMPKKLI